MNSIPPHGTDPLALRTDWTGWTPAAGTPTAPESSETDPRIAFVLRLGRALHAAGYSAARLEEGLSLASHKLGIIGQFFSTPTSIMASFGPQDDQRTFMLRVEPGDSDLGRLARVDRVTRDVLSGRTTPGEGKAALEAIENYPPEYRPATTILAWGIASAGAARFVGGGRWEVVLGLLLGLVIGVMALQSGRHPDLARIFEPAAAFTASAIAAALVHFGIPASVLLATLAGVIVLIPGLTITTAITELSTRHLSSGTARLMGALVLLMGIVFGIAFGTRFVTLILGGIPDYSPIALPGWTLALSLVISPIAFAVLFKAAPRDIPAIIVAGIVAFAGARLGTELLGAELGAFGGALLIGVASQLHSLAVNRPSQITLVPGLLLLVPGSIGLRSFTSMLDTSGVLNGIEGIFQMGLIAVSLAAGILVARVVAPRRAWLE